MNYYMMDFYCACFVYCTVSNLAMALMLCFIWELLHSPMRWPQQKFPTFPALMIASSCHQFNPLLGKIAKMLFNRHSPSLPKSQKCAHLL